MATPTEQQLVSQYGTGMQSLIDAERGRDGKNNLMLGNVVDPQDAARLTNAFRLNPQGVFSTSNINQASANPVPRPDDLLGIRNQIGTELGIPGLNTQYQNLFKQIQEFDQASNEGLVGLEGQPVALNVIRGEQAQLERNRSMSREGIAREMQVAQSALAAATQEQQFRYGIREQEVNLKKQLILENPGAKITFGDSIESAAKKIKKYQDKLRKEEQKRAEKAAEKAAKKEYSMWKKKTDYSSEISFKEWQKKGGGSGGSSSDNKSKEKFFSDASKYRKEVVKGDSDWGYAWNTMKSKYPDLNNEAIDNALGLDLRAKAYN